MTDVLRLCVWSTQKTEFKQVHFIGENSSFIQETLLCTNGQALS